MASLGTTAPARQRVGAIVEEPSFHRYLTGRENLRVAAAVRGDGAMTRIPAVLRRVGLADRADEKVRAYSQGMRQRLGVARCLLADPELLVLDEPMNGLDPGGILELRHMIRSLVDEGRTVFLSSHLLDEVEKTCDAAAVIDHGRILEAGPIGTLLRRGAAAEIEIDCDQPERALDLLAGHPAVTAVAAGGDGIRVTLVIDDGAAAVNTALVQAGVSVSRLEPVRHSLEERFLGLTSTLEGQS
jgi:ABC-2 type transport system ATP-binding protein